MTLDEQELAASAFSERVQHISTGAALEEVWDAARGQTYEEIARRFESIGEPCVARMVREMRFRR